MPKTNWTICLLTALVLVALPPRTSADTPQPAAGAKKPAESQPVVKEATATDRLVLEQTNIADSYLRFKNALLKLSEATRATDPARADLLEKAAQQISASGTDDEFRAIVKLLESDLVRDVDQAIDKQDQVVKDLNALLKLLLSENRDRRNSSEKERVREYLKQLNEFIKVQWGIHGQTERSGEPRELAERQNRLAERAAGIAKKIEANEEHKSDKDAPKDGTGPKNPDKKDTDKKDADKKDTDQTPADPKKSPTDKPTGKPGQDGKPDNGPPKEGQPSDEQANGRQQIEQAVERMRKARERLEQANRKGAAKDQEEAIALLEKAKAELEEILRQLREEELEKTLTALEARFRNMLRMQQAVLDATVLLDKKPAAQRDRADEIEASRLGRREQEIVAEVDKTMVLFREDGSAVAFPEAVEELREDMDHVAQRLNQAQVGPPTQRIEQDVIDALKVMITALEKAEKDLKQRRGMPQQAGEPSDPPLVDAISELKMIRALQVRVNRRTGQYDEMIRAGELTGSERQSRLKKLAEHEQKVHRITRDLHLGKNE